ncbi:MAG TPA: LytTR family DNA-binding domain-containing protein [Candidatus Polarisedimenticolaceae bacterium]|nr:LytTR family DNA-binding domain-containing protein [Candidatus Polarisedimenticolaceae bacterium]
MSALSAVIADDEPLLRRELRESLADLWPELEIVSECGDGASALHAIEEQRPDVSFLDVRMPKLSGLEVAERVQGATQVVFVTAYDEHAVAAFEQGAADYILKPVKHARLAATIHRLKQRLAGIPATRGSHRPWLHWIQATLGQTLRFFDVRDVYYCRSDGKYTRIVTRETEALIRRSLTALLEDLDPDVFWQIHRGIAVNVRYIDTVDRGGGDMVVKLREGRAELPVSRTHQGRFRGM